MGITFVQLTDKVLLCVTLQQYRGNNKKEKQTPHFMHLGNSRRLVIKTSSSTDRSLPLSITTSVFSSAHRVFKGSLMSVCNPNFISLTWSALWSGFFSTGPVTVALKPCTQKLRCYSSDGGKFSGLQ